MKPSEGSPVEPGSRDFEENSTTEAVPLSHRPPGELRCSLVVCSSDGVQVAPLADRPVIIGREAGSSIVVSDRGV
jgi:hypothetical protein